MKQRHFLSLLFIVMCLTASAQRMTDRLDRGLVAVKTSRGVFASWRILGEEYYDTHYNLYRDGTLIAEDLAVSNFTDVAGTADSHYTVAAVVCGTEQAPCQQVDVWAEQYKAIRMAPIISRKGTDVSSHYSINDACAGDLDGDGEVEIIVKRQNDTDAAGNETEGFFPVSNDSMYSVIQAYKLDGTLMWTIDAGPNQVSHGLVELNCQCFDWDMDGRAEVLMRITDGTIIYHPDGTTTQIGTLAQGLEDRKWAGHAGDWDYTATGREYLLYADGATCKPYYTPIDFPLKRLEDYERKYNADGTLDVYGSLNPAWWHDKNSAHRANKFFFGAPCLDGVRHSIFLARGIYTRIKMCALDVDPATHQLTQRWRWEDNRGWDSPWFGQGYHNYAIADVDLDGRDEIVYGSMVIDDNGKGLHTTGLGHGDSQHCADLNPYMKGLEQFACNEDNPNNNYRDATTGKIYFRSAPGSDDGRCMAGNFTNSYLGAQAFSQHSGVISCVTNQEMSALTKLGLSTVFRIYWDGDLCSETLQTSGGVYKYGSSAALFDYNGKASEVGGCNGSKDTPCLQGDILGDWREEILVRSADNTELRIYTTVTPTAYPIYTLWHDHQYRNAMVWQPNGYNQPPHISYFLGTLERCTVPPPPLTTVGRAVVDEITSAVDGQHALVMNYADGTEKTVDIAAGAQPHILTVNAFSHTEGHNDNDNITTTQSTITFNGTLTGDTRLVRQGEGIVRFNGDQRHSGQTDLWGGQTIISGGLPNSYLLMRRFAELTMQGSVGKAIEMEYGAVLHPADGHTITTDSLFMDFGAVLQVDLHSGQPEAGSRIKTRVLNLRHTTRADAPAYNAPVIRAVVHDSQDGTRLAGGRYLVAETETLIGQPGRLIIEGLDGMKYEIQQEDGRLYIVINEMRENATIRWTGATDGNWDLDATENWTLGGETTTFVSGDDVVFGDEATTTTVTITDSQVKAASITVDATKAYTIKGVIDGPASLTKRGTGTLTLTDENTYSGGTTVEGGTVRVSSLVELGHEKGNLGTGDIWLKNGGVIQNTAEIKHTTPIHIGEGGGALNVSTADFYQNAPIVADGQLLTKQGAKTLYLTTATEGLKGIVLEGGTLAIQEEGINLGDTIFVRGSGLKTFNDWNTGNTYSLCTYRFKIDRGSTLVWTNVDWRCEYRTQLFGQGTLTLNTPTDRTSWTGDWSTFEGTVKMADGASGWSICNNYGLPKATLDLNGCNCVTNNGQRFVIGVVKGTGKLKGVWAAGGTTAGSANTWAIGALNTNFNMQANICDNSVLEKVGTGKMTITTLNDFTGGTKVSAGELCISNSSTTSPVLGSGNVTVAGGATLSGKGVVGGITNIQKGALLRPGTTATTTNAVMYFAGKNLTLAATARLELGIAKAANETSTGGTCIADINRLTMNGTVSLRLSEGIDWQVGDSIVLWKATSCTGTPVLENYVVDSERGLYWDDSQLQQGILKVTDTVPTAIAAPMTHGQQAESAAVYDLSGRKVADVGADLSRLGHGVFIINGKKVRR